MCNIKKEQSTIKSVKRNVNRECESQYTGDKLYIIIWNLIAKEKYIRLK